MMKYSLKKNLYHNFIFLFVLILNIQIKEILNNTISEGTISKINLYTYISNALFFKSSYSPILIHILPIDCEINIVKGHKEQLVDIKNISNFNYDAYSMIVNSNDTYFNIIPLMKEQEKNGNCILIANQIYFPNSGIPQLKVIENEPVFLYFNNVLKLINLLYKFENNDIEYPIIISFFISEKIKFKIEISDGKNIITNRIINYKENIIIKAELNKTYIISITPNEKDIINSTMIVKIFHNNSFPFYLPKNQLNLGFIPKNIDCYYYYMKVYKGEEGEIILFNKRQNGILKARIIGDLVVPHTFLFTKYYDTEASYSNYLKFNIYNQKLSFNSSNTKGCYTPYCFLILTYFSNISKSLDINGTEFSLLSRVWNKEESKSQTINIPLNEYIFGIFDETSFNIHYFSVFIPYDANNIYIEIHGMNILGYFKEGNDKINTISIDSHYKKLFDKSQNKMIIKLNPNDIGINSFKGKYISFAFEKDSIDINSYYYFRILQQYYENDYMIYPLDTNKENYCKTNDNKCYFLLKNDYNILLNKIIIYGYGKNDISYKVYYMKDTDYYSSYLNLNHLNDIKEIEGFNGYLNLDLKTNESFILIEIKSNSNENENLTILSSFYNQKNTSFIDIYSYLPFHLSENEFQQYHSSQDSQIKYRILINNTKGEGYINFNQACNDNNNNFIHLTEQKIYSFSIPKNKSFFICSKENLTYNIKIIYDISNDIIKELNYQYNLETIDSSKNNFPLFYFIKDVKYNGININFAFKNNFSNNVYNNLVIKGYGLDYSEIISMKDNNNFQNEIKGKFDNITNSGTIELSNELLKTKFNKTYKYLDDKYFMIIIENSISNFQNLSNDIYVISKDENYILLPINKYIRNSFNLIENKNITQKYFFEKGNITNNTFILEFSSNYKDIILSFNNLTNYSTPKIIGGFQQYILSIESNNSNDYYFNVIIKPINQINIEKSLKEVNIIIKYYNESKINTDYYICNKKFTLAKEESNEKTNLNYLLIINNMYDINNYSNDLNYSYYLRLIKNNNILFNEEINTISLISSNLSYINKYEANEKEFYFNLNSLEFNEKYIALLFIKIENKEEEKYYSMTYEFNTGMQEDQEKGKDTTNNNSILLILIFIIILIIILFLFFIFWRKYRIKSSNLEDKIKEINFSSGINDDLINNRELSDKERSSGSYLNSFI